MKLLGGEDLPHSSADAERLFSMAILIKSKSCNCLNILTQ